MENETENTIMAEGGSDEIVEKVVCGLCSGEYKQPKLLPCFHSYCLARLEKYVETNVQGNSFDCPLCDATAEVPTGGVSEFEWNIYLDSKFKSETYESPDCDVCGAYAVDHCTECEENYCERCAEIHLKLRATRTHTLIAISGHGARGTNTIKKKAFCSKHAKEEIKVVCKDCDKMLCVKCKLTDHEKHNSVDIEDEALNVKKILKETIRRAENSLSKLDKILDNLNDTKDENSRNKDEILEKLQEHGDKLKEQIDKKIREIEKMINNQFRERCSNIICLSTKTEKIRTSLTNLSVYATKIVSPPDVTPLLTKARKIAKQMEQCISKAENHNVEKQDVGLSYWKNHLDFAVKHLGLRLQPNAPNIKLLSNIGECHYNKKGTASDNVCSLSADRDSLRKHAHAIYRKF